MRNSIKTVALLVCSIFFLFLIITSCGKNPTGSTIINQKQILYVAASDDNGQNYLMKLSLPDGELLDIKPTSCYAFEMRFSADKSKILVISNTQDPQCDGVKIYNRSDLSYFGSYEKYGFFYGDSSNNIGLLHTNDSIYQYDGDNLTPTKVWPKLFGEGELISDGHYFYGTGTQFNDPDKVYKVDYLTMQAVDSFQIEKEPGYSYYVDHSVPDLSHNRLFMLGFFGYLYDFANGTVSLMGFKVYKGFAFDSDYNSAYVSDPGDPFHGYMNYTIYYAAYDQNTLIHEFSTILTLDTTTEHFLPYDLALSKDNRWLAVNAIGYGSALLLLNTETGEFTELIRKLGNYDVNALLSYAE